MQRLTKYALLLKAILKKTEAEEQQETLKAMAKKVEAFVSHVNSHLRQRQENERLKTIIARIDSYEPVVSFFFKKKFGEAAHVLTYSEIYCDLAMESTWDASWSQGGVRWRGYYGASRLRLP